MGLDCPQRTEQHQGNRYDYNLKDNPFVYSLNPNKDLTIINILTIALFLCLHYYEIVFTIHEQDSSHLSPLQSKLLLRLEPEMTLRRICDNLFWDVFICLYYLYYE